MSKHIGSLVLVLFALISFSSLVNAAVTLTVENGLGYPGAHENRVDVSLHNPDDNIRAMQMDICDTENYLACTGCEPTSRIGGLCFHCISNELINGCCRVVMYNIEPSELIEPGAGPLITVNYTVSGNAPVQSCRDLNVENVEVSDEFNRHVDAISVPGDMCFQSCISDENCVDSSFCNGEETCNTGTGICMDGNDQCQSPTENFCEELTNQCVPEPTTPITLFVGSNAALPGSQSTIDLILYNPDNAVSKIEADICDDGNYLSCVEFTPNCQKVGGYDYSFLELDNGCCKLTLFIHALSSRSIMEPLNIGSITYNVAEGAPLGESIALNLKNVRVLDYDNNNELAVTSYPGEFCFSSDPDSDAVSDCEDNCPSISNPDQADTDGDGTGNVCENMNAAIPTLSEWGMIIFMTIIVGIGVITLRKKRMV